MGLLERLSDLGARPGDSRDERLRYGTLIFASLLIALISVIWVAAYLAYGYPRSAAIPAFYQLTTVVGLVTLARTHRFDVFRTTQLLVNASCSPALLQATLGGFVASSGIILWAIFVPLAALALVGIRRSLWWLAAFLRRSRGAGLADPVLTRDPRQPCPRTIVISVLRPQHHGRHRERLRDACVLRRGAASARAPRARGVSESGQSDCCSTPSTAAHRRAPEEGNGGASRSTTTP